MVFCKGYSLTGVRASAAQNAPVNKICSECGAVLLVGARTCTFCTAPEAFSPGEIPATTQGNLALNAAEETWRGELNQRLEAYRARRRKLAPSQGQSELPFVDRGPDAANRAALQVDDAHNGNPQHGDHFAFSIAIGRPPRRQEAIETRLLIDVSVPPQAGEVQPEVTKETIAPTSSGLYPVASLVERRRAAIIDVACLTFAYGGFLVLFGSLGGHFTLSKLSAAVCFFTFAFVYLQYFGLFTIFGGTTPGMMMRGLQVASFSGETPTAQQYLLRATGYVLSAGTLFLGFLWALWDEDTLTWHDRLSRTYLTVPEFFVDTEPSHSTAGR